MKKIYPIIILLCITAVVHAQTGFGIKAGPDFSRIITRADGNKINSKTIMGFTAGVYAYLPLRPALVLQPALLYEGKGGKTQEGIKNRIDYLSLPVDVLFTPRIGYGNLLVGAGPYLAYALSGRAMDKDADTGKNLFKGDHALKRLDAGIHLQLGYEFNTGISIAFGQEIGLVNLYKGNQDGNSFKNRSFHFTIGYRLK